MKLVIKLTALLTVVVMFVILNGCGVPEKKVEVEDKNPIINTIEVETIEVETIEVETIEDNIVTYEDVTTSW